MTTHGAPFQKHYAHEVLIVFLDDQTLNASDSLFMCKLPQAFLTCAVCTCHVQLGAEKASAAATVLP